MRQKERGNRLPGKNLIFLASGREKVGLFLACAVLLIVLDQLSKSWIRDNLYPKELLPGFINLVYSENRGAVFGLPVNQTFVITVTIAVLIIIIFLFLRYFSLATTLTTISLGLIFGGATGNLIDRLRFGFVTDFIDMHLKNFLRWPWAFNFADAAIVIGTLTLAYSVFRLELYRRGCDHNCKVED